MRIRKKSHICIKSMRFWQICQNHIKSMRFWQICQNCIDLMQIWLLFLIFIFPKCCLSHCSDPNLVTYLTFLTPIVLPSHCTGPHCSGSLTTHRLYQIKADFVHNMWHNLCKHWCMPRCSKWATELKRSAGYYRPVVCQMVEWLWGYIEALCVWVCACVCLREI